MADDDDRWTIRGVPLRCREQAASMARRRGLTVGTLVCQALDALEIAERAPMEVLGPHVPPSNGHAASPGSDLVGLLQAAAALSGANSRQLKCVPGLTSLVAERVREARGLPPLERRTRVPGERKLLLDAPPDA